LEGRSRHGGPSAANHAGQTKQMADGLHILPRDLVLLAGTLSGGIIRWATSCQSGMCSGVAPIRLLRVLLQVQESWRRRRWISIHWGPPAGIASSRAVSHYLDGPATVHRGKMCSATDCRPVHLSCRYHTGKRSRMFQRPGTGVHPRHGAEFFSSLVARVR
jgi:hypothetical protein